MGNGTKKTSRRARGSILIMSIGVMIILTGLALVFSRQMRVEALASGNLLSSAQADAVLNGAIEHIKYQLANNTDPALLDTEIQSEAVPIGAGQYWIVRPDPEDEHKYGFGLVSESSKLNLNFAVTAGASAKPETLLLEMLTRLPGMTAELSASIVDWRDADDTPTEGGGGESEYYLLNTQPYYAKNSEFESLDELLLLKGATREILFGADLNRNGVADADEATTNSTLSGLNGQSLCGIAKYLTVFSRETATTTTRAGNGAGNGNGGGGQGGGAGGGNGGSGNSGGNGSGGNNGSGNASTSTVVVGKINVNTAPREVLRCLPGLTDGEVDTLIATRTSNGTATSDTSWVSSAIPAQKFAQIAPYITARSQQFSADIVAAGGNGRAFKRCKVVFDIASGTPKVIFCKDITHLGWPLDTALQSNAQLASTTNRTTMGGR